MIRSPTPNESAQGIVAVLEGMHAALGSPLFYVSCIDGSRYALLAGPFLSHQEASDRVRQVADLHDTLDPRAAFYAYGVARVTSMAHAPGKLNERLGIVLNPELTSSI